MSGALLGEWSRLLMESLVQAGLRHAVISPGSRSTPFAWAAGTHPELACHSVIDERAAGFFALGLARATGSPALVLCTSGSAAANYFPAVVEASLARVPLLVLTADRPFELQDVEAPQTIDQVKLYGTHVRRFFELGVPDAAPGALAAAQRLAAQALHACRSPDPGPVHLNARARKPLEPGSPETAQEVEVARSVDALIARGVARIHAAEPTPAPLGVRELADELRAASRGVIVCGPAPLADAEAGAAIRALAERLAMPVYAEATSQLRFGEDAEGQLDALDWLFRTARVRRAFRPDCVLRFGGTPTSSGVEAMLLDRAKTRLHVVTSHGYPDSLSSARTLCFGSSLAVAGALTAELEDHRAPGEQLEYKSLLARENERAWSAVDDAIRAGAALDEPIAVRTALEALPSGGLLVLGNSLPVREADAYRRAGKTAFGVLCQRGANGIDGLIAGAAGAALASGKPTLLLLGDVSFAHDLGGLAAARLVGAPLAVVILDNEGGRIFEQLPLARLLELDPARAPLWLTPPRLGFEHAGPLFDLPYAAPLDVASLRAALARAFERRGASLV
ncbi:MAG TPA: 2-succinyl-5-enolpyruvyl-6-hydroxy-3-cyclohexene-1-carboxylic-acid synthase, partial [Polyangiaceae bacterium]